VLEVVYHHAEFSGTRTSRVADEAKMSFFRLSVVTLSNSKVVRTPKFTFLVVKHAYCFFFKIFLTGSVTKTSIAVSRMRQFSVYGLVTRRSAFEQTVD